MTKPIRMAGVKKVAQSLADANLSDCTLKAWIWGQAQGGQSNEISLNERGQLAYEAHRWTV